MIRSSANNTYCSIVSAREVAIKHSLRTAEITVSDEKICEYARRFDGGLLALDERHIAMLKTLRLAPGAKEHRAPFDRMLMCQAKAEGMRLLRRDALRAGYGEPCVFLV